MFQFDSTVINDFAASASREWLETNGLGGFASSTIIGLNTRRYHGLLIAATKPPVGRVVMLSKLEEVLIVDGRRYELSTNQYQGAIHPKGFQLQTRFELDPFPVFTYEVDGLQLQKSIFMVQGQNTTVVRYTLNGKTTLPVSLEVRPLIAFRDYHSTTHENTALNPHIDNQSGLVITKPYSDLPPLYLAHNARAVDSEGFWYRNFQYSVEQDRGLDFVEDLYNPICFKYDLTSATNANIMASTEPQDIRNANEYRANELGRRRKQDNTPSSLLMDSADQFLVSRGNGKTVIAGYHWFSDWGRDTMIALPGLLLTTGKYEIAKSVLSEFAKHVDRGMLPNRFPDAGEIPEYNTVDATLWFFEAVRALLDHTQDYEFVRQHLYAVLTDIIEWHVKGTRYNIHVESDGLLESGEPGVQLTWMDAKVRDRVITPRHGKPVEIQALWYNALRVMEALAAKFDEPASEKEYAQMADKALRSFGEKFWNENGQCLYDVINADGPDAAIRPNQIIAISLKHSMVPTEKAVKIVRTVEQHLLTPRGLRSLSPSEPQYRGRYRGDGPTRDSAYHQGTVWPWLMGPYFNAYAAVFGADAAQEFGSKWLANFKEHLSEACLGQISEVFDGDEPHAPRGCVAQAWSVSEILRGIVEFVSPLKSSIDLENTNTSAVLSASSK